jgi:hypothetical protein
MSRDNGYFKQAGVDVELVCCPGGTGEVKYIDQEADFKSH